MTKPTSEEIFQSCPILFRGKEKGPQQTLMFWGFECGEGWFDIIFELSKKIEAIAQEQKKNGVQLDNLPKASQVKEKFGVLRFYVHNTSNEIEKLIEEASAKSASTCELCCQNAKLKRNQVGWFNTLCNQCDTSHEN